MDDGAGQTVSQGASTVSGSSAAVIGSVDAPPRGPAPITTAGDPETGQDGDESLISILEDYFGEKETSAEASTPSPPPPPSVPVMQQCSQHPALATSSAITIAQRTNANVNTESSDLSASADAEDHTGGRPSSFGQPRSRSEWLLDATPTSVLSSSFPQRRGVGTPLVDDVATTSLSASCPDVAGPMSAPTGMPDPPVAQSSAPPATHPSAPPATIPSAPPPSAPPAFPDLNAEGASTALEVTRTARQDSTAILCYLPGMVSLCF